MAIPSSSFTPASEPQIPSSPSTTGNQTLSNPSQPVLHNRPVGQHAASHGFKWNKPADHHKYLITTGLPEVHAAVLNGDWVYAKEILCAEDVGLQWLPTISQRQASKQSVGQVSPHWALTIASSDQSKQARAIIDMAINLTQVTNGEHNHCLYGTNLLTLCLELPAPAEFTQKVIDLAKPDAPAYLSLPDGSGRTPLYIAIERRDPSLVRALLDAGANPIVNCRFVQGEAPSAYHLAMGKGYEQLYSILLEKMIPNFTPDGKYSIWNDKLAIKDWVIQHDEAAVRKLADQFPVLRDALFNYQDESGISLIYRHLKQGNVDDLFDVTIELLMFNDPEKNALYAAALGAPVKVFSDLLASVWSQYKITKQIDIILMQTVNAFFINRSTADIKELLEVPGKIGLETKAALMASMKNGLNYSAEKFISLAKLLWPTLHETEKNDILVVTTKYPEACFHAVLGMMDCLFTEKHIATMFTNAGVDKHKAAWEFAADRLPRMLEFVNTVREKNFKPFIHVFHAVEVGSLRWFDAFMNAGFDLQEYIDLSARDVLPRLADLDPAGLQKRLAGYKLPTDDTILAWCKTEQGRQALSELMKANLALQ